MKKVLTAVLCVIIGFMLNGCSKELVTTETVQKQTSAGIMRSIYIYMSGGDAEKNYGSASAALKEMTKVEYPENVNVIVQTGGALSWQEEGISSDRIDRFEVQNGGIRKVDSVDDDNMGESETLMDFLKWGNEKYPAKSRTLIIWGQGGGCVGGAAYDARHDYDSLTPGEVAYALSRSGVNYDLVGFDACMMSSLEMAAAIAPYASFMAASEEYQPCGWDYEKWLSYVCESPQASADNIGKVICETYYNKCVDIGQEDLAVAAVTDLSKISALTQAFNGLAGRLCTVPDSFEKYKNYALNLQNAHMIGGKTEEEGFSNMLDLGDFSKNVSNSAEYNYNMIEEAIKNAVIYKASGAAVSYACGIGIFYPIRQNTDELNKYFDINPSSNYTDFLRSICARTELGDDGENYRSSWAWSEYMNERGYFQYAAKIDNNCYELNITGNMDIVKNVTLKLYRYDEESGEYLYVSDDNGLDVNREAGIYKDNGDNSCIMLNGKFVTSYLIDSSEGYSLYSIPVYINGVQGNIRVAVLSNKGKYKFKVYGFWRGINAAYGMSDRNMEKIGFLDEIEPFSPSYNSDNYYKSKPIRAMIMSFKRKSLPDGEYKLEYIVEDIYGNKIEADPSVMTILDGNAVKK